MMLQIATSYAAQPFDLPDCAGNFGAEVVLTPRLLDAMIRRVEPGAKRPDQQQEQFFITVKYYLERSQALLLLQRSDLTQRPLVLSRTCVPLAKAPAHIRSYFANLEMAQKQLLVTSRDKVWGSGQYRLGPPGARPPSSATTDSEGERQAVRIGNFRIDIYEVTNRQFHQFIEAGGYTTETLWSEAGWQWRQHKQRTQPSYWADKRLNASELPVVGVTWYEAEAYCRWAGKLLPTEAQWNLACQGTEGRTFPWGNQALPSPADSPDSKPSSPLHAVGSSPERQTPEGVQDLAGNVMEWTRSEHNGQQKVLKGSSGHDATSDIGCAGRYALLPGVAANFIGFRCLAESVQSP